INANQLSLNTVLDKLLTENGIAYEVLNDRIVLTKIKYQPNTTTNTDRGTTEQQAFPVTGKVVDENGQPLPGVSIRLNATDRGTNTDADGNFTINVDADTDVLTFSFIGYDSKKVTVGANHTINVQMSMGKSQNLNEVVVVGYGTAIKSNLSSSIGSVKGSELRERPTAINIAQGLSGRVAGVNVMTNSGKPGGNPTIVIRGIGSFSTTSTPLFVVDGFVGANPQNIDPNIVETMDVLKDAAASAIYGSRGANGVVIITTRRGKAGVSEITLNSSVSFASVAGDIKTLDATQALEMIRRQYDYVPGRGITAPNLPGGVTFARKAELFNADGTPKYNTDWVKESTRLAVSQNHSLTFAGGTDKMNVVANLNYRNNEGLLLNSYDKRVSGYINLGWDVKPWLNIQTNINTGGSKANNVDLDPFSSTAIRKMYEMLPFYPVRYADGEYSKQGDFPGRENSENPVKLLNEIKNTVGGSYALANFIGTFHIAKNLDFVTSLGGQTEGRYDFYYAGRSVVGVSQSVNGRARRIHLNSGSWTNENYFNFKNNYGKHNINVVGGASWYMYRTTITQANAQNFFDDYFTYNNLSAGSDLIAPLSTPFGTQVNSFFGRLNYNFNNTYLFGASFRADGASQFGLSKKYGYFPSFSAGWNIANEEFFKNSSISRTINLLKIRGSYGVVGNAEIPAYSSLDKLAPSLGTFNGALVPIVTQTALPNPDLAWESAKQMNVALDMSFLNSRLNVTVEYYDKRNSNLLYTKPLPITTGQSTVFDNIGEVQNKGFEVLINTVNVESKDFRWTSSFNFAANQSKVLSLKDGVDEVFISTAGHTKVGRPVAEFFGFVREGIWGTAEATEAAKYGKLPGDTKWLDANGNGVKDLDDRRPLGTGMPKWEMNLINTISYKGFTLLIDLQSKYGLSLINFGKHLMQNSATRVNSFTDILNAWTPTNQNTMVPALRTATDPGNPSEVADSYAVEDASFLRVRNLGLNYRLSSPWLQNILLKNVTVGVNVENAFLFSKYSGFDPEYTSFGGVLDQGVDIYQYPKPRTVTFSLVANF
ncbi:MAG: TonB-dependent receptor, partial [Mucilaginibacter sp.]